MRSSAPFLAAAALLTWPAAADAHLVTTGLGPFYDGVTHLFLSPNPGDREVDQMRGIRQRGHSNLSCHSSQESQNSHFGIND